MPELRMKYRDLLGEYVKIVLPVLISDSFLGIGNSAVAAVMGHIGAAFVSANVITTVTLLNRFGLLGVSKPKMDKKIRPTKMEN